MTTNFITSFQELPHFDFQDPRYMSVENTTSQQSAFLHITEVPQGHSNNMLRFSSPSASKT